ncbi:hypothetical protein [Desulfurobacterium indicum]|uniref:SH3b domain-containing protein n=1 Tax=Desulfurobacterium indicum TaxID=1914305 RepID=A0A1R1MLN3_9BACT|nr:hypothetical protein [Desulfurobacterium indicum]OMH40630.1 hypothetical protein BLW93_04350 [Desulfurobacterium indicum]
MKLLKNIATTALILGLFNTALADTATVMIDSLSIRNKPDGEIVETIDKNSTSPVFNYYKNWARNNRGWIDSDFTKITETSPNILFTETIKGKFLLINKDMEGSTKIGKITLNAGKVYPVILIKNDIAVIQTERGITAIPRKFTTIFNGKFPAGVILKNASLINPETGREITFLKKGTFCIKLKDNLFIINGYAGNIVPISTSSNAYLPISSILNKLNMVIDTFNSARVSSAITERLGYFPKVLPLTEDDIKTVTLENGKKGVFVNIKYLFYDLDGSEIKDRKTRLILKKGNEVFWQKLSKEVFRSSSNVKFIQLNIFRFNGKGSFEKKGFVAVGITDYKNGICDAPPEQFMDRTESELSEDLWFFANQVYERVENGN